MGIILFGSADQTARMCRLIHAFVVCLWHKTGFLVIWLFMLRVCKFKLNVIHCLEVSFKGDQIKSVMCE